MKNLEQIKEIILSYYTELEERKHLEESASDLEDPFLEEFTRELNQYLRNSMKDIQVEEAPLHDPDEITAELEELPEEPAENMLDIETLTRVEEKVMHILQYLNLEFYNKDRIKEVIIKSMAESFDDIELSEEMKGKIEDVIKNLVDHEFGALSSKKKERRRDLIKQVLEQAAPFLNEQINYHHQNKFQAVNRLQERNFQRYISRECHNRILLPMKNEDEINFDE